MSEYDACLQARHRRVGSSLSTSLLDELHKMYVQRGVVSVAETGLGTGSASIENVCRALYLSFLFFMMS